jgi:hypothetical protein
MDIPAAKNLTPLAYQDRLIRADRSPSTPSSSAETSLQLLEKTPSYIIEIGQRQQQEPLTYSSKPRMAITHTTSMVLSENPDFPDKLTQALERNNTIFSQSFSPFSGILSGLGELAEGNQPLSQRVANIQHNSQSKDLSLADFDKGRSSSEVQNTFTLSITTKDGDTVKLTISDQKDIGSLGENASFKLESLGINFELDGDLSQQEMDELAKLGHGLEKLYQSFSSSNAPDISQLNIFDSGLFSSLNLDFKTPEGSQFHLSTEDGDLDRSLAMSFKGNNIDFNTKKNDFDSFVSESDHQASINHYLKLIDSSVEKSHGSDIHRTMLSQSFEKMHEANPDRKGSQAVNANVITSAQSNSIVLNINKPGDALLTGLSDFTMAFRSNIETPNMLNGKPGEFSGFKLDINQTTHNTEGRDSLEIDQQQNYKLSAGYYTPLPGLELVAIEEDYQSYQYFQVEEEHSKDIRQLFVLGESVTASVVETSKSSKAHTIYDNNKLTHHQVDKNENVDLKTMDEKQAQQYKQDLLALIDPEFLS